MSGRSRSSTVSSLSSQRSFVTSNPSSLVGGNDVGPAHAHRALSHDDDDDELHAPKSYRSEHSLRTIRAGRTGGGRAGGAGAGSDDNDEEEGAGDSGFTVTGDEGAQAYSLQGRRTGPQFVIDLDPGEDTSLNSSPTRALAQDDHSHSLSTGGGRPRSSTFGGIELPPSPHPSSAAAAPKPTNAPQGNDLLPRPALAHRGRSTSVSSLSSLRSLDPALHLGGAPLRERRPVLYAGLQAGALLVVSVLGLYLLLKGLLPPIDEEHKKDVKLPKSFDDLKRLNEVLQVYRERNNWRVMGCYVTVYLFLQAFSIPGSMYLSILGGALWGVLIALPLVCFCVASGALLCYLMSAALGPAVLLHSEVWQQRVDAWTERVMKHKANLISYLIILRIAPLPPHWVVNVVAPHLQISVWTFWISTFFGIAGVSYIHTQIGTTLDQMTSSDDFHLISWQNGLGLGGIILAVLIPVALRRFFASDIADAAEADHIAGSEPSEPLLHPRASLSLDEEAPRSFSVTPRSSTDGSWARRYEDEEEEGEPRAGGSGGSGRPVLKPGGGSADKVSRVLGVQVGGQQH
ncbi:hypothetical protein JCM8097_008438 [Rhodosporidiobolus ruineniae]